MTMTKLNDAMRALIYFVLALVLTISQIYADVCSDRAEMFDQDSQEILNKRMVSLDDLKTFAESYALFKEEVSRESCALGAIDSTKSLREQIKSRRAQTIKRYLDIGIKEEGGKNIQNEYDYLMGQSPRFTYEFENVFSYKQEAVVIKRDEPQAPPRRAETPRGFSGKCGDTIVENDTVNLQNVRNQDTVGWCYAYTAADLLSFKVGKKISAVSLYNSADKIDVEVDIKSTTPVGGFIGASIDKYLQKKNGLCLEEDLPSSDFKFCTDKTYLTFLNNLLKVVKENRFDAEMDKNTCFGQDLERAFPGFDPGSIKAHINRFGTRKLVEAAYDRQCRNLSFKGLQVTTKTLVKYNGNDDTLMNAIDERLKNNEIAAIGYDYSKINAENGTSGHGSIVVGKRTNPKTGKCDYLVRNSWGKTCDQKEHAELSCHKNCEGGNCRFSGHFWVGADLLKKSLLEVTYLQ